MITMVRVFCLLFLFISTSTLFSQNFRLVGGLGANFSRASLDGLNFVLNRYNETRQGRSGQATVTRPMQDIKSLSGVTLQLGFNAEFESGLIIATGLTRVGRRGSTYAEVTDINNRAGRRDVRYTANSYNIELGTGFSLFGRGYFLIGGSTDFFNAKNYTRLNDNDYEEVMSDLSLGFSLFTDLSIFLSKNIAIGVKPYYQLGLLKNDFTPLNRAINSSTYTNDDFEDVWSSPSNVGVQFMLRLHVADND